ncbi:MAG: cyclic nucleotide-binding domain-containing protein [Chloroflexota bacterium]
MTGINYLKFEKTYIDYHAGEIICEQGDEGDLMYTVVSGEVLIDFDGEVIDIVGEGGIIGEMALVGNNIRSASAIASTDCTLKVIDTQRFLWLVHETPTFATQVMGVMAERIRRLNLMVDTDIC